MSKTTNENTVQVSGLPVTPFSEKSQVIKLIEGKPGFAVAVNAEKIILARQNLHFKKVLRTASLLYADGVSVVKTLKSKGFHNVKIPGCELWLDVMKSAALNQQSVYLLGGTEEVNKKTIEKLRNNIGLKNIVGQNGYDYDEEKLVEDISRHKPNVVTVALGSPKQELLIYQLREVYPSAFYMGVGGSYDVFVGHTKRAPVWVQKAGLEWLYRLLLQPSRAIRQASLVKYLWLHFTNKL